MLTQWPYQLRPGQQLEEDLSSDIINHASLDPFTMEIRDIYVAKKTAKRREGDQSDLSIPADDCTSWTNPDHAHYTIVHHILSFRTTVLPCVREKHNLFIDEDNFNLTFLDFKPFLILFNLTL